ncbi:hypothetical protein FG05_30402 [Fusarium graminearum]|nr:hypothetical protein FG05_30402 [Fusarium graminearum]
MTLGSSVTITSTCAYIPSRWENKDPSKWDHFNPLPHSKQRDTETAEVAQQFAKPNWSPSRTPSQLNPQRHSSAQENGI